jgi:hypothetical protein
MSIFVPLSISSVENSTFLGLDEAKSPCGKPINPHAFPQPLLKIPSKTTQKGCKKEF